MALLVPKHTSFCFISVRRDLNFFLSCALSRYLSRGIYP